VHLFGSPGWLGGSALRERNTRLITLTAKSDARLDFLGYTFRYEWGQKQRTWRCLCVVPSAKAVAHRRAKLREITNAKYCMVPIAELVTRVNRQNRGWANYFSYGFVRNAQRIVNNFAVCRLTVHLKRRSQRACRPPAGMSYYTFLTQRLGLELL
jgi:RNA-directed DNA polymerase